MVTVKLNTGTLDVLGNFTYTRQVGDIGDVATSNANFTNSFEVRRDKTSISALNGLSLVGSLSNSPYIKVKSLLHINGIDLISDGWLQIRDVDKDKFKLSVLDGNVDFWKAIENVALDDIDLSEADHDKNLQSVIASFSNDYYKYILADYGGVVMKFFLYIDEDEQAKRFQDRLNEPEKNYKITTEDWRNRKKWDEYILAMNEMLDRTHTENAPWYIISGQDKYHARHQVLKYFIQHLKDTLARNTQKASKMKKNKE